MVDLNAGVNRLIGRDSELAALDTFLGAAAEGGVMLAPSGEPGVGKTALLHAAAELATTNDVSVRPHAALRRWPPAVSRWFADGRRLTHPLHDARETPGQRAAGRVPGNLPPSSNSAKHLVDRYFPGAVELGGIEPTCIRSRCTCSEACVPGQAGFRVTVVDRK